MNRLTLIVDGGWLMMSRFGAIESKFRLDAPNDIEQTKDEFIDMLFKSLFGILHKFPEIDNIIITLEGGSWRKELPTPKQLEGIKYKGNRDREPIHDWDSIYRAFDVFIKKCEEFGITTSKGFNIEGDDWVWYWSKTLNERGINTIIWTSDCDLKQLVNEKEGVFTCWFNDKTGLTIPDSINKQQDLIDLLLYPPTYSMDILEKLRSHAYKEEIINPNSIVMEKVMTGDNSDNIKSCARIQKGKSKQGIGPVTYNKIMNRLGNPRSIEEFRDKFNLIADDIVNNVSTFRGYDKNKIIEMLRYNLLIVWLSDKTIPQPILEKMNKCEYKKINCKEFKTEGPAKLKNIKIDVDVDDLFK